MFFFKYSDYFQSIFLDRKKTNASIDIFSCQLGTHNFSEFHGQGYFDKIYQFIKNK